MNILQEANPEIIVQKSLKMEARTKWTDGIYIMNHKKMERNLTGRLTECWPLLRALKRIDSDWDWKAIALVAVLREKHGRQRSHEPHRSCCNVGFHSFSSSRCVSPPRRSFQDIHRNTSSRKIGSIRSSLFPITKTRSLAFLVIDFGS